MAKKPVEKKKPKEKTEAIFTRVPISVKKELEGEAEEQFRKLPDYLRLIIRNRHKA